jgi:hypothetical protein
VAEPLQETQVTGNASEQLFPGERRANAADLGSAIEQVTAEWNIAERAMVTCLADNGLEVAPRIVSIRRTAPSGGLRTWLEQAELDGYGIVSSEGTTGIRVALSGGPEAADFDTYQLLLAAECAAVSNSMDVERSILDRAGQLTAIPEERAAAILAAPEVAAAFERWRDCMKAAGYPYPSQEAAFDDLNDRYDALDHRATDFGVRQTEFAALERAVATTDRRCILTEVAPVVHELGL